MELSIQQQIHQLIEKSKEILLVTRKNPTEDSIGSLLAMGFVLEKMGKEIDAVCSGPTPTTLSFLPKTNEINSQIKDSKKFIISLDTSQTKVAQLSYDSDQDGNTLNIYITPKEGKFSKEHITTKDSGFSYDLIIIIDSPDLEDLGLVYEKNTELFYETPIINIDHHPTNEQYGEINLVDITATSTAEVLYNLLESLDKNIIDEKIATCLLTSIISTTRSFQLPTTTPRAFSIAAELISLGADQQKIIQNIFKNKSLAKLRLWGRALARIKHDSENKLTWTLITQQDFLRTKTSLKDLDGVGEELATLISDSEILLLLYEKEANKIQAVIKSPKNKKLDHLAQVLGATLQNNQIYLNFKDKNLLEVEKEIVTKIRNSQPSFTKAEAKEVRPFSP